MNADVTRQPALKSEPDVHTPVDAFSDCHAGILHGLRGFATLPPLVRAALRAHEVAVRTMEMMDHAVLQHHKEEEEELFVAVLRSAQPGEEHDRVQAMVWQLTDEHRTIEGLWKKLRPQVARAAAGKPVAVPEDAVDQLVSVYRQHAQGEERIFLPAAQVILGRDGNHMAALGISLHLRHASVPIAYL